MNADFKELLAIFNEEKVEYMIIGGYAVIFYSQPRSTKDLDLWLKPSPENAQRILKAFSRFGLPLMGGITPDDFESEGVQYVIGTPPSMIDFLTSVPGLDFDECWKRRVVSQEQDIPYLFLGKEDLITSKKTAGRLQDLADIEEIERAG